MRAIGMLLLLGFQVSTVQAEEAACKVPPSLTSQNYDTIQSNERNRCLADTVARRPDYNMLVLSWSPNYCSSQKVGASYKDEAKFQCETNKFGWVVHGLWGQSNNPQQCVANPEEADRKTPLHPRYCKGDLPKLPEAEIRAQMCTMPGAKLVQAQWEKHGACIFDTSSAYFAKIRELRAALQLPDSIMSQTQLFSWMRANNPALAGRRLDYNPRTKELQVCYDKSWRHADCPARAR